MPHALLQRGGRPGTSRSQHWLWAQPAGLGAATPCPTRRSPGGYGSLPTSCTTLPGYVTQCSQHSRRQRLQLKGTQASQCQWHSHPRPRAGLLTIAS